MNTLSANNNTPKVCLVHQLPDSAGRIELLIPALGLDVDGEMATFLFDIHYSINRIIIYPCQKVRQICSALTELVKNDQGQLTDYIAMSVEDALQAKIWIQEWCNLFDIMVKCSTSTGEVAWIRSPGLDDAFNSRNIASKSIVSITFDVVRR